MVIIFELDTFLQTIIYISHPTSCQPETENRETWTWQPETSYDRTHDEEGGRPADRKKVLKCPIASLAAGDGHLSRGRSSLGLVVTHKCDPNSPIQ